MRISTICLVLLLLSSCTHQTKKIGQKIQVPVSGIEVYSPLQKKNIEKDSLHINTHSPKIYTLIDASCSTCILSLIKWDHFQSEIAPFKVQIIPVCYSEDNFELLKYLFENDRMGEIKLPLYLDFKKQFIQQNKAVISKTGVLNVLVDYKNNILLSGDPLNHKKIRNQYMKKIRNIK